MASNSIVTMTTIFSTFLTYMDLSWFSFKQSKANKLEFKLNSNAKIDLSLKKEDVIKEMKEIYAKVGNWTKFCELCLKNEEFEQAIMAAPHVSIDFWKKCLNSYVEWLKTNEKEETALIALMGDNLEVAMDTYKKRNEPKDAQITWLTRKFGDGANRSVKPSSYASQSQLDQIEDVLNNLSESDELFRITLLIAKDYLLSSKPILAAASFLAIRDVFWCFKILIMANELDLALLISKFTKRNEFDLEITSGLLLRELKKNK